MDRAVALVTGASGGLGAALAADLAGRGHDLVLTARDEAMLEALADRLRKGHGIGVTVQPADLAHPRGASDLVVALDDQGLSPAVIVNNAGFGVNLPLADTTADRLAAMLQVNIASLTELTRCYATRMSQGDGGHILLVASMAAYMPAPMLAAYAASKAFVLSLGHALHVELAPKVGVTVLSPGYMETGFAAASGFVPDRLTVRTALRPDAVARIGLDALFAGRSSVVAGRANRIGAAISGHLPRGYLARQVAKSMQSGAGKS